MHNKFLKQLIEGEKLDSTSDITSIINLLANTSIINLPRSIRGNIVAFFCLDNY